MRARGEERDNVRGRVEELKMERESDRKAT